MCPECGSGKGTGTGMIKFAWDMYKKYEEAVNYLFFGFLAFVVNMGAYALAAWVLGADDEKVMLVLIATAFAWVVAVLFAYWTNRTFVFKSEVKEKSGIRKEFSAFVGARIVTGVMELVIMYVKGQGKTEDLDGEGKRAGETAGEL